MTVMKFILPILIALALTNVSLCNLKPKLIEKCLKIYVDDIAAIQLDPLYVNAVKSHISSVSKAQSQSSSKHFVLDIGLGSMKESSVSNHMIQLNVSGVDINGLPISNCKHESTSEQHAKKSSNERRSLGSNNLAYVNAKNLLLSSGTISWLVLLVRYPNTLVLMNDLTDEEYFANQKHPECSPIAGVKVLPDHCYLPILQLGGSYDRKTIPVRSLNSMLLSAISHEKTYSALAAYRKLIACTVPAKQLFQFNLNSIDTKDYWSRLITLLNVPITPSKTESIISAGLKAPLVTVGLDKTVLPNVCTDSAAPVPWIQSKAEIAAASVTTAPALVDSVATKSRVKTNSTMEECAMQYADALSAVFGSQYHHLIFSQMMRGTRHEKKGSHEKTSATAAMPIIVSNTSRLVLGIGPGSTGSRSIFSAASQLNITGRHSTLYSTNCSISSNSSSAKELHSVFEHLRILSLDPTGSEYGNPVFWADSPASEHWFHILRMYPNTRILMTDVRDTKDWFNKRVEYHCNTPLGDATTWNSSCTVPLAFGMHSHHSNVSISFLRSVHLSTVDEDAAVAAYNAYRKLVHCAVPKKQLWWLYIKEQDSSPFFWRDMMKFFNVTVRDKNTLEQLVFHGVPRVDRNGCFLGNRPCGVDAAGSIVLPSVCF